MKPLSLFPAQILCATFLVLFPVALHLLYTKATGDGYATVLSDLNFLNDWSDVADLLTRGDARDVSWGGCLFRVMGISVHFLANSLMWPLCIHVAASCLLDANPPLIQSLKAALHASRHVLGVSLPCFLLSLLPGLAHFLARCVTGAKSPPFPPSSQEEDKMWMTFGILMILPIVFMNSMFGFAKVMASLRPDMHDAVFELPDTTPRTLSEAWRDRHRNCGRALRTFRHKMLSDLYPDSVARALETGCKYTLGWRSILFLLHLQFYVQAPHLDYLKFWVDVEECNIASVALSIMSITMMAFLKVCIVVYICALCLHKRAAHVEAGADSEPSKDLAAAKIWTPFEADNKSTILAVVAAFDGALGVETLSSPQITPYKTFGV